MTAAIALAIVLVIAVAGMSLAMQSQRPTAPSSARPPMPGRRPRERRPQPEASPPPADPEPAEPPKGPELLRRGTAASARVLSVVDERTLGPVTRSRLALSIAPEGKEPFETTIRVAFPTPAARARVKVGSTVPVRFDPDDRTRVVLDWPD